MASRQASRTDSGHVKKAYQPKSKDLKQFTKTLDEFSAKAKSPEAQSVLKESFKLSEIESLTERMKTAITNIDSEQEGLEEEPSKPKKVKSPKSKLTMDGKNTTLSLIERATAAYEKFESVFDTEVVKLQIPKIIGNEKDDELIDKYRIIQQSQDALSFLKGYLSFIQGHICVLFRDNHSPIEQKVLYAKLAKILKVTQKTVGNYFAHYKLCCQFPIFIFIPARVIYQHAGVIDEHLKDEKFLELKLEKRPISVKEWIVDFGSIQIPNVHIQMNDHTQGFGYNREENLTSIYQGIGAREQLYGNVDVEHRHLLGQAEDPDDPENMAVDWVTDIPLHILNEPTEALNDIDDLTNKTSNLTTNSYAELHFEK